MKQRVVVTREVFDETIDYLRQHFDVVSNQDDRLFARDELFELLKGAVGIQSYSADRIDAELLDHCPDLRAVCNTAVGYNNIDLAACTERGIMAGKEGELNIDPVQVAVSCSPGFPNCGKPS